MEKSRISMTLKKYTMVIALVVVFILFIFGTRDRNAASFWAGLGNASILFPQNITNLLSQNTYAFVLGTGMLLCILTGGNIDLAVGSVLCFAAAVGSYMMNKGLNPFVAVLVMVLVGLLVGIWQGFWIAYIKVPPFIATLSGMYAFRGLANVVLNGMDINLKGYTSFINLFGGGADCYIKDFSGPTQEMLNSADGASILEMFNAGQVLDAGRAGHINYLCVIVGIAAALLYIGIVAKGRMNATKRGYETTPLVSDVIKTALICAVILFLTWKLANYKGIPTSFIWVLLVVLVYGYITTRTRIGRHLYAVGGNAKAAALSGINTKFVYFFAYINMGLLTGLAGALVAARLTKATPKIGEGYEMDAIGACFIGGASAYGGIGTVPGVVIGALLTGIINQGMSLMGIEVNWQKVAKGVVLLAAVIFDVVSKNEKK
ncbi:MAG: sugar ABC transporter permease [Lachnospiraceae bacterium]|nr:sugar ABC transporter permease [Lachnospiraceae bacterium]